MAGRSKVTVVDPGGDETDAKWYKGLEKVQSYFAQPYRTQWDRKTEFILSCVGYCIGFGNIWRYPYVVYENGGSAFFIPYLIVTFILSLPLFFLEATLGQFSGCNPISAFNFAPAFKGIGIGMILVNFFIVLYYIVFLAYTTKYLFASFYFELPWGRCIEEWGADENCFHPDDIDKSLLDLPSCKNLTEIQKAYFKPGEDCFDWQWPAEQYWHKVILRDEGSSLDNVGEVHWDLFLLLLLSWFVQYLNLIRGIKTSGKVVYFTATFPFLMLSILLIYSLTLSGAGNGLKFLFQVDDWSKVFQASVWRAAITQSFYSTGIAFGCLIMYSSYNNFAYNIQRITIFVVFLDFVASLLSSMTVFSVLGYLANEVKKDVSEVVASGPGLVFVTMPQAIAGMPVSHLWSVLYFIMLYTVGIDSQAVLVDTIITVVYEEIPKFRKHEGKVRIGCIITFFLLSVPTATSGGIHVVGFLGTFSVEQTMLFIGFSEVFVLMYIYGIRKFNSDYTFMRGTGFNFYWKICWLLIIPILFIVIIGYIVESLRRTKLISYNL